MKIRVLPVFRQRQLALAPIRNNAILIVLWLYLLLGYGFMQIRLFNIPIAELLLLFSMLTINHRVLLPKFLASKISIPILVWWIFGLYHILWNVHQYGIMAIRDGSHIIESFYLYIGFAYAAKSQDLKNLANFIPVIIGSVFLYALTFPFREFFQPLSPVLTGFGGEQPVPLLFNYTSTTLVLLAGSAFFLQEYLVKTKSYYLFLFIACIGITLLLFPSRTLILRLLVFFALSANQIKKLNLKDTALVLLGPIGLLFLVSVLGISVNSRIGTDFQPQDYLILFSEIFKSSPDSTHSISSGNEIRFLWWWQIIDNWRQSVVSILFGMGYGMPLTDFVNTLRTEVREPHNELIGILGRGGLIGLLSFLWFQTTLLKQSFNKMRYLSYSLEYSGLIQFFVWLLVFTLVSGIGESPFSMAYYTVPFYFIAGILLRVYKHKDCKDC
jgi:hypothetical protein